MSDLRLLEPVEVSGLELPNRIVMAPMTRRRAGPGDVPPPLAATYYAQRASAGLIVSEAAVVSPDGASYPGSPGIFTDAQVEGWRRVTRAVRTEGGRIFCQLWHAGRVSHPDLLPDGMEPVAPSAVPAPDRMGAPVDEPFPVPRALEAQEVEARVEAFGAAARRAREAGFDGVEVHAANGYLVDQFLRDGTNRRADRYGGDVARRARFLLEVVDAVSRVWSPDRVGVQISPTSGLHGMRDSDPPATFGYVAERLEEKGIGYLHVHEMVDEGGLDADGRVTPVVRERFGGPLVVNGGYDRSLGEEVLEAGRADLVSFGRLFISNPDLPRRFEADAPLADWDSSTFYGGGTEGYTDYPFSEGSRPSPVLRPPPR